MDIHEQVPLAPKDLTINQALCIDETVQDKNEEEYLQELTNLINKYAS